LRVLVLAEDHHYEPVRRIVDRAGIRGVRITPMRGNRVQKLVGYVRCHPEYNRFVVLKDLERLDEEAVRRRLEDVRRALPPGGRDKVVFVVVRRAVEAWVLADPDAIEEAIGCEIGRRARQRLANPEAIEEPKEELKKMFRRCGKIFNANLVARIAEHIRLDVARQKARSLDEFLRAISSSGR